ncbi:MAG TPA: hypothetical protein VF092_10260 [Longimicrobium sp.]
MRYLLVLATLLAALGTPAHAQIGLERRAQNVAVNGAVGGVLAGARALLTHGDLKRATVRGFAGGAMVAGGKQLATVDAPGMGLVARQVAAAGTSLIYSAAADTFVLLSPIGPVTLEWRPAARRVGVRVSVAETARMLALAATPDTRLDLAHSLSFGTPVFVRTGRLDQTHAGSEGFRMMTIATVANDHGTRSHELIHVIQEDEFLYLVGLPLERMVTGRVKDGWVRRHLDLGLGAHLLRRAAFLPFAYCDKPSETEAYELTEGTGWRAEYCPAAH